MSEVYFANLRARKPSQNVPNKIKRLFRRADLASTFEESDLVAVKTHFGEPGNTTFLRPQYLASVVDLISREGGKPFLTDCGTLYLGSRTNSVDHITAATRHGFTFPVVNAPVVIADGLRGKDQEEVEVNLKHCKTVKIGKAAMQADSIIAVSHVKGHMLTGFGGALKNIGMGFGSRAGKLEMHHVVRPTVRAENCRGCGDCRLICPSGGITIKNKKAQIDLDECIGCGECYLTCNNDAIDPGGETTKDDIQERIVEYCYGILKDRMKKSGFISFIVDITPDCDCPPWSDSPIVPDIGILASRDIVAIDQASADLINAQEGIKGTSLKKNLKAGEDKIKARWDVDWETQLRYAEDLGLGKRKYNLVSV